jgi:hypothetical protein
MTSKSTPKKVYGDEQQGQDESDDSENLHPAWCADARSAVEALAGVIIASLAGP